MVDRNYLKLQMPRGYLKKVASQLGISQKSISNYLTGRNNSERIEIALLKELAQIKAEKNRLYKKVYDGDDN